MKGYMVFEWAAEFEQGLKLDCSKDMPKGGVLDWGEPYAIFATRADARAAINRTEYYRLAFNSNHPERKHCKVVRVVAVDEARAGD